MELRNDNFNLIKKGIGLKFTGKGINDFLNNTNIYNSNGIGIQLITNQNNYREIALVDTLNIDNNSYSKLKIGINNSSVNINNLNEINQIQSLNFNNNLIINNNIGIGSTNPKTLLDVSGRISCYDINIGGVVVNKDFLINVSTSVDNITSGILKIDNGGTGVYSVNNEQLLLGKFQQSPFLIWKDNKRRLGIGLTDPLYTLDVFGGVNAKSYKILGTDINNIFLKPPDLLLSSNECYNNCYNDTLISANRYTDIVSDNLINLFKSKTSDWILNGNNIIYINTKVGIGTNRPNSSLHVIGDINYSGLLKKNGVALKFFSGDYNDLSNVPKITWELSNANIYNLNTANVGIGTNDPRSKLDVNGDINFTGNMRKNGVNIDFFSGNYNDLSNIPSFSKIAYSGSYYDINEAPPLFSGDYEDLYNKPSYYPTNWNSTIYNIPTYFPCEWDLSVNNKPQYFPTNWISIKDKPLTFDTDWNSNIRNRPNYFFADWDTTIVNKPNTFFTDWNSNIINKPDFATVAFTGQYSNILNKPFIFSGLYRELREKPHFSKVAFTGNYNNLFNRPDLFSGYFHHLKNLPVYFQTDWNSTIINKPDFSRVAYTGIYDDLIDKPNVIWGENNSSNIYNCNVGNVGIGITNPTYKLDVRGSFNVDNAFQISGLQPILKLNAPWGLYFAEDYVVGSTNLPDSSGNNRHATTSANITKTKLSGNGASEAITYISGGTSATITWPDGSIPRDFTILTLTRYSGATKKRIIVSVGTGNWLHGHYNGNRGVCRYQANFLTENANTGTNTNWLCCIGKNNRIRPYNILVDGIGKGTIDIKGDGGYRMGVNNDFYGETSDWALGCVMIWDRHLLDAEMFELNRFIEINLRDGGSTKALFLNQYNIYFNNDVYFSNQIFINNTNISNIFATSNDFLRTSNWVINGNNIYNVNTGSIGINTTNPSSLFKLDVNGAINSSGYNITGNGGLLWSSIGSTAIGCASSNGDLSSSSITGDMIIRTQEGNRLILQNGTTTGALFIYNNKIGIGTDNPSSLLHLHNTSGDLKISMTDTSTGTTATDGFAIFKSATDDGNIWNYENNAIRFGTYNTERMTILGNGNIGIGTTIPNSLLHLHNTSSPAEIRLSMTDSLTGIGSTDGFVIYKSTSHDAFLWNYENNAIRIGTNTTERMTILNNGNIGIGTTEPISLLHLHNTSGDLKISFTDSSTLTTATDGFAIIKSANDDGNIWNYENNAIRFGTFNIERMCILGDGKVGIGTTIPNSLLHLHNASSSAEIRISMTDISTDIGTTDGFAIYKGTDNNGYLWNYESNALRFGTNNTEKMCILGDGNIGIGTNTPISLLHLHNTSGDLKISFTDASTLSTATDGFAIFKSDNDNGYIWNYESNVSLRFGTFNTEKMCILGDGKVGIGTNNPTSHLHLHNSIDSSEIKISMTEGSIGIGSTDGFAIYKGADNNGYLWNYRNNAIRFGTFNTEKMTILNNGNIGINSTNPQYTLDVNGTINANFLRGDGSNISNLNLGNIASGSILSINRGGTGVSSFNSNQILIGNGTTNITQSPTLVWVNNRLGIGTNNPTTHLLEVNGTINATSFIGNGSNISNLNANYISSGIISTSRGGTGVSSFNSNQILIGNGTTNITQSPNLVWSNNSLGINISSPTCALDVVGDIKAVNFHGNGANITNLNLTNTTGTLSVDKGGTGQSTLTSNYILIGNGTSPIRQTANLVWSNNSLGINISSPTCALDVVGSIRATSITGDGANISNLNANNISGVLSVSKGGTGTNTLTSNYILIGSGTNAILQTSNLVWVNSTNKLGIMTSNPQYTLDIVGDINFTGIIKQNGVIYNASSTPDNYWVASGNDTYYNGGNVAIGVDYTLFKLDVNGSIKCSQINIGTTTILKERLLILNNSYDTSSLSKIIFGASHDSEIDYGSISYSNGIMTFFNKPETGNGFYFSGAPYIGIGTTPEKGIPLKVASGTSNLTGAYYNLTTSTNITLSSSTKTWSNISAYFESHILVNGDIVITSDVRIKNNINDINSKNALELVSKINPKSFKYIDFIEKGDKKNYGFIAQDIKEIVPEAVGYKKENIPNIFKLFDVKDDIIETNEDLTSQLSINDNIKIINKDNKDDYNIIEISSNHIKIDKKIEGDKCFIYGKEIEDFHILDKDIIFTLNVSATQELNKKIKKQKKNIKKQEMKLIKQEKIIKERKIKLKEQQKKIDLLFELLANK